jgi:hypothetical protein
MGHGFPAPIAPMTAADRPMTSVLLISHLAAVLLAALALWTMRFEFGGNAASRLEWAAPAAFAVLAAVVLLVVSAGKRFELWAAVIVGRQLIRVPPAWDGGGAAALLLLLALLRFVTSSLMGRQSSGFGVLAAGATFLAAFLAARYIVVRFYKAPRSIHLDMTHGRDPHRTLAH